MNTLKFIASAIVVLAVGLYWLVVHSWQNAEEYQRMEDEG